MVNKTTKLSMGPVPLKSISLSHSSAPVEIRELIYLPEAVCKELLVKLRDILGIEEALVFSTCNRTEVYYVSEADLSLEIIKILCVEKGISNVTSYVQYFRVLNTDVDAIRYLFEVSMGLHSNVLGDLQISNQIKKAYIWSNEIKMAGAFLHRLLHTIFHTNKRVHQETPFRDGAASVSYAAAELAAELSDGFESSRVLVVGLGEMGQDVAKNLDPDRIGSIVLCNRTRSKAEKLAQEIGAEVLPFEELDKRAREFDLIVSSVSVETPLFVKQMFIGGHFGAKFLVDLCVPRSFDPALEEVPHLVMYNVDDINSRTNKVLAQREKSIPDVKAIIEEELSGFMVWRQELSLSPTIHKIKEALEQIRKEEMSRFLKKANEKEEKLIDEVTRSMMNKFMKLPVLQLKDACKRGEQESLIDLLNDLFDLERSRRRQEQK